MQEMEGADIKNPNNNPQPLSTPKNKFNKALLKHKDLLKILCKSFIPHQEYFTPYLYLNNHGYITSPKPTYHQQQEKQHEEKISLSLNKQMQYLRGACRDYIGDEQFLGEVIMGEGQGGTLNILKNRSYYSKEGRVYWAHGEVLRMCRCGDGRVQIVAEFEDTVHEIGGIQGQEALIFIRCRHWAYLFNVETHTIAHKMYSISQLTTLVYCPFSHTFYLTSYTSQQSFAIFQWNPLHSLDSQTMASSPKIPIIEIQSKWPIHSTLILNKRQLLVCQAYKICLLDTKTNRNNNNNNNKKMKEIGRVQDSDNDRFVSMGWGMPGQIVVCARKDILIMEVRNDLRVVRRIRHMCEESPPVCLQTIKYQTANNGIFYLLLAHSPYLYGSSLLVNLNPSPSKNKIYEESIPKVQLLFDSGKVFNSIYPHSISYVTMNMSMDPTQTKNMDYTSTQNITTTMNNPNPQLTFYHIDSSQGIFLEKMVWSEEFRDFTRSMTMKEKEDEEDLRQIENPNHAWVKQTILEPYIMKKNNNEQNLPSVKDYDQDGQLVDEGIFKRKVYYCSLDNFSNRIKELARTNDHDSESGSEEKNIPKIRMTQSNTFESQQQPELQQFHNNSKNSNRLMQLGSGREKKDHENHELVTDDLLHFIEENWEI